MENSIKSARKVQKVKLIFSKKKNKTLSSILLFSKTYHVNFQTFEQAGFLFQIFSQSVRLTQYVVLSACPPASKMKTTSKMRMTSKMKITSKIKTTSKMKTTSKRKTGSKMKTISKMKMTSKKEKT